MAEIYVSTDIEADGPIPGPYSMLSFASAALTAEKQVLGTFSANLELLPGAQGHPDTMAWWKKHPQAWAASRKDLQPPQEAMKAYADWLNSLPGTPIFVAYPATYDFMFVYWYLMRFNGCSPFRHRGLDIRSYAMAALRLEFSESHKGNMLPEWFEDLPHTHTALDDALEQGMWFINLLNHNLKKAGAQ